MSGALAGYALLQNAVAIMSVSETPGWRAAQWTVAALVLVLLGWAIAIVIQLVRGGEVERPNRIPQLYGYTICLIAVIIFLINVPSIVDAVFDLANPAAAQQTTFGFGPELSSFGAYQATYQRTPDGFVVRGERPAADTLSEATLRARYDALRAGRLAEVRARAEKSLVRALLLVLIAVVLFVLHWRWLRSRPDLRVDVLPPEVVAGG